MSDRMISALAVVASAVGAAFFLEFKRRERSRVEVTLPAWLVSYYDALTGNVFKTDDEMMEVAVEISSQNVKNRTGGPFGCAIFKRDLKTMTCTLYSVGCNRVTALNNSTLHGETVAIQFAQKKLKSYSLRASNDFEFVMCTSAEPCAMCLGATLWAGPSELLCSATKHDAEALGFDEGPVYADSYKHLEKAGIKVKKELIREAAQAVLKRYGETGEIYNS